tara:strand:+ start:175 stop:510 length:336 start_codon:yes stop_codon:yes gene_type:complete
MNNLKMLEMALNALKQCTSNEWVDNEVGQRYNIEAALSKIKKSRIETYSEQIQNELEPIGEPLSSKIKLHDKTGVPASGSIVVGGVITNIGGLAVDWTFHTTDDDCEFENG